MKKRSWRSRESRQRWVFRVLHTHDVAATLAEKGFPREPLKIIEICNAKYASQVLNRDVKISLMLPCPISVYVQGGKTEISTLLPSSIAEFFPRAGIEGLAAEVESVVFENHRRGTLDGLPDGRLSARLKGRLMPVAEQSSSFVIASHS